MKRREDIRNVAIIAHAWTTARPRWSTPCSARAASTVRPSSKGERILDSNDLEREPCGIILILAKNIANQVRGNQDQPDRYPGPRRLRAARSSRTLQMADGALVLVDAFRRPDAANEVRPAEGVREQHPADRGDQQDRPPRLAQRPGNEVLNEIFDTFVEQGASEDQLDFPYIYASGKAGFASHDPKATSRATSSRSST